MMVTPDGHSRLELSRFFIPSVVADHRNAPVNALGYLRAMFTVSDIDETLTRLRKHGAQVVGEVVEYEDSYRLCYIRGSLKLQNLFPLAPNPDAHVLDSPRTYSMSALLYPLNLLNVPD